MEVVMYGGMSYVINRTLSHGYELIDPHDPYTIFYISFGSLHTVAASLPPPHLVVDKTSTDA